MNGIILEVQPLRKSNQRDGDDYHLVIFQSGEKTYRSYLCPGYQNFPRWRPLLTEGTRVDGLIVKRNGLIDADSPVRKV